MKTSLNTLLFYGLFILLISDSCKKKSKIEEKYADFDVEEMQPIIEQHLKQLRNDTNFTHYFDTLFAVYEEKAFAPQCLIEIQDSMLFESIKKINDSLVYEGLKPMHYKLDTVIKYLSIAKKQKVPEIYESLALADLHFTNF